MSEVAVDASAFDLPPRGGDGRVGALCLHGLTGTPYEVRPIAEALAARGIHARGPVLPGHDTGPEELARLPYSAWLETARDEIGKLRSQHETVCVAGLSLGGVTTLAVASEGLADAIAVVATPLRLHPAPLVALIPFAKYVYPYLPKRQGSDIQEPAARARQPGYPKMPLRSLHELMKLQGWVRGRLARISVPIFVSHGLLDRTADLRDAHEIAGAVSSDDRRLLILERSGHVVPVDYDGARMSEEIARFFEARGSSAGGFSRSDARPAI
ncbi:MAG: alpha/beta fold hydrolase [Myxococcota bacterium]|nr:alpha/beta fold hydrolase [Myxococcota bacterium]